MRVINPMLVVAMTICMIIGPALMSLNVGMAQTGTLNVVSDTTVTGFRHPESVAYDARERVLFVSQFGSVLKPTLKDGKGMISKVSLKGELLEQRYFPASEELLNKPKGIWIEGNRLWVTDIDVVWIFDLESRRGKAVVLAQAESANDPTVINNVLFISDSNGKRIYKVEPAHFLEGENPPDVTVYGTELSFAPNGLYPSRTGGLLVVGHAGGAHDYGIYLIENEQSLETLVKSVGSLDGLVRLDDDSLLVTDWKSGSLLRWHPKSGIETLSKGFGGPADFCVIPESGGYLVVVPDLVKSELRLIRLAR